MAEIPGRGEWEKTFSELVREYGPSLHAFACRTIQDEQMAEDIIQDVFLKLWQTRAAWKLITNMEAWLYRVTENRIIDHLRKKGAELRYRRSLRPESARCDLPVQLELREARDLLSETVRQLPGQRQTIYRLHKEESLSYREIADEMQLSPHTVKNQLFAAIRFLRSRLRGLRP